MERNSTGGESDYRIADDVSGEDSQCFTITVFFY